VVKHQELTKIEDLVPAPYNPREISDEAAAGLAKSMGDFGDLSGVVWNKRTGHLVCGHQRVKELQEMGGQFVKGAIQIESGERFPVRVVSWPESKEKVANVTANNPRIAGVFTEGIAELLPEIKATVGDEDFGVLQFDSMAKDLGAIANPPVDVVEDEVPEPPKNPVTKLGDVWRLGDHAVVCGDFVDNNIDMCDAANSFGFTSPPYNAGTNSLGGNKNMTRSKYKNDNDNKPELVYFDLLTQLSLWMSNNVVCHLINIQTLAGNKRPVLKWIGSRADYLIDRAVWDKGDGRPAAAANVMNSRFEDLLFFSSYKNPNRRLPFGDFHGTVSNIHRGRGASGENVAKEQHAAVMPIHLASWAIGVTSKKAVNIMDPFLGSGTTLIASEQLGRKCYGVEIEPAYVDVTIERWENLTGGKAKRAKA
jgi:DNA modification methylase